MHFGCDTVQRKRWDVGHIREISRVECSFCTTIQGKKKKEKKGKITGTGKRRNSEEEKNRQRCCRQIEEE